MRRRSLSLKNKQRLKKVRIEQQVDILWEQHNLRLRKERGDNSFVNKFFETEHRLVLTLVSIEQFSK